MSEARMEFLRMWMFGLGIPLKALENERVKMELNESPVDGVGLLRAIKRAVYDRELNEDVTEAIKNLESPRYQLEFMMMMRK